MQFHIEANLARIVRNCYEAVLETIIIHHLGSYGFQAVLHSSRSPQRQPFIHAHCQWGSHIRTHTRSISK